MIFVANNPVQGSSIICPASRGQAPKPHVPTPGDRQESPWRAGWLPTDYPARTAPLIGRSHGLRAFDSVDRALRVHRFPLLQSPQLAGLPLSNRLSLRLFRFEYRLPVWARLNSSRELP